MDGRRGVSLVVAGVAVRQDTASPRALFAAELDRLALVGSGDCPRSGQVLRCLICGRHVAWLPGA